MVLPSKSNPLLRICDTSPSSGRSSLPHLRNSKLNAAHVGVLTLTLSSDSSVSSTWLLLSAHPLTEQHNVLPIGIFFIATNVFSDLITGIGGWFQTLSSQPPHSSHDTTLLKNDFPSLATYSKLINTTGSLVMAFKQKLFVWVTIRLGFRLDYPELRYPRDEINPVHILQHCVLDIHSILHLLHDSHLGVKNFFPVQGSSFPLY